MKDGVRDERNQECPGCHASRDSQGKSIFSKLDTFTQRHLNSLKFVCRNAVLDPACKSHVGLHLRKGDGKCTQREPMGYQEALKHMTSCIYEKYHCPYDCLNKNKERGVAMTESTKMAEEGILGLDMIGHLKRCDYCDIECEKCGITF